MKLLYCNICNDLIQLRNDLRGCYCGCQIGRYLDDNNTVEIASKYLDDGKLIGISNRLLMGYAHHKPRDAGGYFKKQKSNVTIIPWNTGDRDVVYVDWGEMHAELIDNMQAELFGELTDPEVARAKIQAVVDDPKTNGISDSAIAKQIGCDLYHLSKLLRVPAPDDAETIEASREANLRAGLTKRE